MTTYFKAIGKIISDCGITNGMVESSSLANDLVSGFLIENTSIAAKDCILCIIRTGNTTF